MPITETQQVPVTWLLNWTLTQVIETILTYSEISRLLHFPCCFPICLEFYNRPIPCRSQIVILTVLMCIVHLVPLLIHFISWKRTVCESVSPAHIHWHSPQIQVNFLINHFECETPVSALKVLVLCLEKHAASLLQILCFSEAHFFNLWKRTDTLWRSADVLLNVGACGTHCDVLLMCYWTLERAVHIVTFCWCVTERWSGRYTLWRSADVLLNAGAGATHYCLSPLKNFKFE
jgi:hypothetical protein